MGSRSRARRAQRSDSIDTITKSVSMTFGNREWTVPQLRQKDINITQGIIKFMHITGLIAKKRMVATHTVWSLTVKGRMRAMKV
jgi:hypothetical protein